MSFYLKAKFFGMGNWNEMKWNEDKQIENSLYCNRVDTSCYKIMIILMCFCVGYQTNRYPYCQLGDKFWMRH